MQICANKALRKIYFLLTKWSLTKSISKHVNKTIIKKKVKTKILASSLRLSTITSPKIMYHMATCLQCSFLIFNLWSFTKLYALIFVPCYVLCQFVINLIIIFCDILWYSSLFVWINLLFISWLSYVGFVITFYEQNMKQLWELKACSQDWGEGNCAWLEHIKQLHGMCGTVDKRLSRCHERSFLEHLRGWMMSNENVFGIIERF